MLEKQPIVAFPVLPRPSLKRQLVLVVVALGEILQDASTLEYPNLLPIVERVQDGRDAAIGVDFQKPRLLLPVGADVDVLDLIGELKFFQGHADLDAIWRRVGVEFDVSLSCHCSDE